MSGKKIKKMLAHEENIILTDAYMNQPVFFVFIFVLTRACEYPL
jgi:hypothetical protein